MLFVVSEPDVWMVNLVDSTGRHIVDLGPSYNFSAPIVPIPGDSYWKNFQFGCEVEFMRAVGAEMKPQVDSNGVVYRHSAEDVTVSLLVIGEGLPSSTVIEMPDETFTIVYTEYLSNLPLDLSLFEKPDGVEFSEG